MAKEYYDPPVTEVTVIRIENSILSTVDTTLSPLQNGEDLSEGW